mgnify:CR=1 FL=1
MISAHDWIPGLMAGLILTLGARGSAAVAESPTLKEGATENVRWLEGPTSVDLRGLAAIAVPNGYIFADASGTRLILRKLGNAATGREIGIIAPKTPSGMVEVSFTD